MSAASRSSPLTSAGFIVTVAVAVLVPILAWYILIPYGVRLVSPHRDDGAAEQARQQSRPVAEMEDGNCHTRGQTVESSSPPGNLPQGPVTAAAVGAGNARVVDQDAIQIDTVVGRDSRAEAQQVSSASTFPPRDSDPVTAIVMQQQAAIQATSSAAASIAQDPVSLVIAQQAEALRASTTPAPAVPTGGNGLQFMDDRDHVDPRQTMFRYIDVGAAVKAVLILQLVFCTTTALKLFTGSTRVKVGFETSAAEHDRIKFMVNVMGLLALWGSYLSVVGLACDCLKSAKGFKIFTALYFGLTVATPVAIAFSAPVTAETIIQFIWSFLFLRHIDCLEARQAKLVAKTEASNA